MDFKQFYSDKTVLVTGHTGFKGTWLTKVLLSLGANVVGFSLSPPTVPNLYSISKIDCQINSIISDICDYKSIKKTVDDYNPDIVFHLAAQPLVSVGYSDPVTTYTTNVIGTVNILESIRSSDVKSFLNITTDKVYHNKEWCWGYRENDELNGYDPYSNSKSCSELVTSSYYNSFLNGVVAVSTARAGNVIGGGDFTNPRIIPDCIRAAMDKQEMVLRNPKSIRPYQHVLEPIFAYLLIAAKQYDDFSYSDSYNIGPSDEGCVDNETLVKLFGKYWGSGFSYEVHQNNDAPHEANYLKLDCSKIHTVLEWKPIWNIDKAVEKTVEWTKAYLNGLGAECMEEQIDSYLKTIPW